MSASRGREQRIFAARFSRHFVFPSAETSWKREEENRRWIVRPEKGRNNRDDDDDGEEEEEEEEEIEQRFAMADRRRIEN